MLRPTKHSHPDRTVINVAFVILMRLRTRRAQDYRTLRLHIRGVVPAGDVLFMPALYLLFLLGLVRYQAKTDSIELKERDATL